MQIDVVNFEAILYKSTSTTSIVEDLKDLLQCRSNTLFLFFWNWLVGQSSGVKITCVTNTSSSEPAITATE